MHVIQKKDFQQGPLHKTLKFKQLKVNCFNTDCIAVIPLVVCDFLVLHGHVEVHPGRNDNG